MQSCVSGDARLHCTVVGSGSPVLLLHPIGLDHSIWTAAVEMLSDHYQVIAMDLPGHGASTAPDPEWGLEEIAEVVIDELCRRAATPAHIVGVSFGGMIAQHIALARPELVKSLVLCSSASGFPEAIRNSIGQRGAAALEAGMKAAIPETIERWFAPEDRDSDAARMCEDRLRNVDPVVWDWGWKAISALDVLNPLQAVDCPALVIVGDMDAATPPALSQATAAALPASDYVIVPGAAHMGIFAHPDPFLRVISAHLRRADPALHADGRT